MLSAKSYPAQMRKTDSYIEFDKSRDILRDWLKPVYKDRHVCALGLSSDYISLLLLLRMNRL